MYIFNQHLLYYVTESGYNEKSQLDIKYVNKIYLVYQVNFRHQKIKPNLIIECNPF